MTWNYRVVRVRGEWAGRKYETFEIREVYYEDGTGNIDGIAMRASTLYGESVDEIKGALDLMVRALDEPVLDDADFTVNEDMFIPKP